MTESFAVCSGGDCLTLALLALLPSILWILFFVFQDKHREKAKNVAVVFLWGAAVALPVVIAETTIFDVFTRIYTNPYFPLAAFAIIPFLYNVLGVAFVEEIAKYAVVKFKAVPKAFFDEPQDAMLYMIIAALGFASIENVAYTLSSAVVGDFDFRTQIALIRGVTSTLLHITTSGALGYFLALSIMYPKERKKFLYTGIILATLLHVIYNNLIIKLDDLQNKIRALEEAGSPTHIENFGIFFEEIMVTLLLVISTAIVLVTFHRLASKKFKTGTSV